MVGEKFLWGVLVFFAVSFLLLVPAARAQVGNSGTINGTVTDASGAAVPNATVRIHNPVSQLDRTAVTDAQGAFAFANVPFNPYHLDVTAKNFAAYSQDVDVRSSVPVALKIGLAVSGTSVTVSVEANGGDLVENTSTDHTDVDRSLFDKLPLESQSSSLSSLITLSTPGISADSNGLFHSFGDHAENSFSLDGQPITDQQSKVFSNQIPLDAVQSMEVIAGAPPAQYGDKTSLVIDVTTRSGLGYTTPHGTVTTSYGSFGTENSGFNLSFGNQKVGNFISANGLDTGRFLDPPEFTVMHDKGNEENIFDRVDYQIDPADAIHVNIGLTRSWFQTPNSFDDQYHYCNPGQDCNTAGTFIVNNVTGLPLGLTDQRSQIRTYNLAPTWTRILSPNAVYTLGAFARRDEYQYLPSADPLNDFSPDNQSETISQLRFLTSTGVHSDVSYVHGINNIKAGVVYEQTFLTENENFGIVDPGVNPVCFNADGTPNANPSVTSLSQCGGALDPGGSANPNFSTALACLDLTRPTPSPSDGCASSTSVQFPFRGHTDVKEFAVYVQDSISVKNWIFDVGIRGDLYNGLAVARQAEPRVGIAYNIKKTSSVLRISYARTLETPFNENLVLSSTGCTGNVIPLLIPCVPATLAPGYRNEFHAGLEQAFGKYLVINGEYIWKYTHNAYDFSVLGSTPITFPIEWHNSKIPGWALRAAVPTTHGFTAQVVMSSVAARFFTPQIGGLGTTVATTGSYTPFRIDHDELFNMTAHAQYQPWKRGPWFGFNWRYDSGLVAGATPCYGEGATNDCPQSTTLGGMPAIDMTTPFGVPLTADQEFQAGFFCGTQHATPTTPLPFTCLASQFGSTLESVPAPNTEDDDKNPPRIAPRNVFDAAVGDDNLFHNDKYKWSLRFTVINLTNKEALYNFLSTFSGTHYLTPRTFTGELGFHF